LTQSGAEVGRRRRSFAEDVDFETGAGLTVPAFDAEGEILDIDVSAQVHAVTLYHLYIYNII